METEMSEKTYIEMQEGEREVLHSALEVLSPDDPDDAEHLEGLTQRVLDTTMEPGTVTFEFSKKDLEQGIAALDILDPDDFDVREMADLLNDILRVAYDDLSTASPEI
jgi:hypothetical protein